MKVKIIAFAFYMLVATWLIPSLSCAEETVTGVTKTYNPQSGILVLITQSQTETTVYISKTVHVYLQTKDDNIAVTEADTWNFLKHNLFKGTKVTLEKIEGKVTTIWVLEVPS